MENTINYDGRCFRSVKNSENGEVDGKTIFYYHQQGDIVWADYRGGGVQRGTLIAKVVNNHCLDMRYSHINSKGELMTGRCFSTPEQLNDGRLRMHEKWQWTCGDRSEGESIIEEIP
ncbi:n-acetylglutamate synthase [Fodinibius halophilus]|uniref:N-acetylglutamate synthase n=1 Tax=Fodinibius halophilus TaxID=1736908 RepID=A0A6M1TPK1_9BACT|nr:n-acetylglutamate synthase [Fodinibius halophilus]NGP90220.1 n-acetylglutamate synthase [Fodinibius halophilus]